MKWMGRTSFLGGPRRKALSPRLFWQVMASLSKLFPDSKERRNAAWHLVLQGNPGSGILRGSENIAKTLTYRATYVPGGFNVARDTRRRARNAKLGSTDWMSQFGAPPPR